MSGRCPKSAITHAGGKSFIWRYENGHALRTEVADGRQRRRVDRGHQSPRRVEIGRPRNAGYRSTTRNRCSCGSKLSTLTEGAPVRLEDSPVAMKGESEQTASNMTGADSTTGTHAGGESEESPSRTP